MHDDRGCQVRERVWWFLIVTDAISIVQSHYQSSPSLTHYFCTAAQSHRVHCTHPPCSVPSLPLLPPAVVPHEGHPLLPPSPPPHTHTHILTGHPTLSPPPPFHPPPYLQAPHEGEVQQGVQCEWGAHRPRNGRRRPHRGRHADTGQRTAGRQHVWHSTWGLADADAT